MDIPQQITTETRSWNRWLGGLSAVALVVIGVVLVIFTANHFWQTLLGTYEPFDEMAYADMARNAAAGGVPFHEIWDIKPPVNTYLLAVFVGIFGNTLLAVRIAVLVLNLAFVAVVTALIYAVTRSRSAAWGGLALAVVYASWQAYLEGWEPVLIMATFSAAAMLLLVVGRGRTVWMFWSGVLLAVALFSKQVVAPEGFAALAFAAYFAPKGTRWRAMIMVIVGGITGIIAFVVFFALNGVLEAVWMNAFANSFLYAFEPGDSNWHFNEEFISFFNQYFLGQSLPFLTPLLVMSVPAIGVLLWQRDTRRLTLIVMLWVALATLGALIGRSMRRTYFLQVIPPLFLLNFMALPVYLRLHGGYRLALVGLFAAGLFGGGLLRDPGTQWRDLTTTSWQSPDQAPVVARVLPTAEAMQELVPPDACLWTWDSIGIVRYLADRTACTPEPAAHVMMVREAFDYRRIRAEYLDKLFIKRPTMHTRYYTWGYFPELQRFADRYLGERVFNGVEPYNTIDIFEVDMSSFHDAYANFDNQFTLIGYDVFDGHGVCPGETFDVAMTYRVDEPPQRYYNAFIQILTEDQTARVAGVDDQPHSDKPTIEWNQAGMLYLGDTFSLEIPADTTPGTYVLVNGFYDVETAERLPVYRANGEAFPGDYVTLTSLTVENCNA